MRKHLFLLNSAASLIILQEAWGLCNALKHRLSEFKRETNSTHLSFFFPFIFSYFCHRSLQFLQCSKYAQRTICSNATPYKCTIWWLSFIITTINATQSLTVQNTFVAVLSHLLTPVCRYTGVSAQPAGIRMFQYKTQQGCYFQDVGLFIGSYQ